MRRRHWFGAAGDTDALNGGYPGAFQEILFATSPELGLIRPFERQFAR